jgi:hypothetical protein
MTAARRESSRTARGRDLLAAEVRNFVQHITDTAPIDHVGRRNLVVKLSTPAPQPNVHSFLEGELGFSRIVVLKDKFSSARGLRTSPARTASRSWDVRRAALADIAAKRTARCAVKHERAQRRHDEPLKAWKGGFNMKDYQASIEKLRKDAAEAALIRDLATDQRKREMYDRLSQHLNRLADEVEWAMSQTSRDADS